MLFDSTESLYRNLAKLRLRDPNDRIDAVTAPFHDYHDPEINRLFASSPPAPDEMVSYNFERDNKKKDQYKEKMRERLSESEGEEGEEEKSLAVEPTAAATETQAPFESFLRTVDVPLRKDLTAASAVPPSLLSLHLRSEHKQSADATKISSVSSNQKGVTVYGPDREPIEVLIDPADTVAAVIRKTLDAHEAACRTPPLLYRCPQCYDLRLHEGDGEPDEDFAALDRNRQLKQFGNLNEFCLCRNAESIPKDKQNAASTPGMTAMMSSNVSSILMGQQLSVSDQPTPRGSSVGLVKGTNCPSDAKIVDIVMPQSVSMKLTVEDTTTAKDLLLNLAHKPRMRMLRDEFVFHLQPADKTRLQFTSSMLPPDTLIAPLGVEKLELRKRYFADDPDTKSSGRPDELNNRSGKRVESQSRENILYTDITAAVYQEWTVLKKNKFGRIQERIMGIDSSKIYNYETQTRNAGSVKHAQRNLSSVLKVEYVPGGDNRTFKILFAEEGLTPYEIEYQCATARNCAEIVSKLNYLLVGRDGTTKR